MQDLDLMPVIVENEVTRQLALADIKDELIKRNAKVEDTIYDLDEVFKDTSSKILSSAECIKNTLFSRMHKGNYPKRIRRTHRKRGPAWKKIWNRTLKLC